VNKLEFQPSAKIPALQYVGDVEPGGEAEKRGVKKGDYILEVCFFDFCVQNNVAVLERREF
jgi:SH3/ankyrin repeat-containing protein